MDVRVGFVVLLVLAGNWGCDARNLVAPGVENAGGNVDMCTICEDYASLALVYLGENKTQAEIMDTLHNACFQMHNLKEQCITLVDYYAPLFFSEVSSVQPEGFCKRVGLCRNAMLSSLPRKQDKCDLCHNAIDEILVKLKDPETKMEIIQMLLKACNSVENYMKKCKSLVFEFGPMILIDAQKFIEKTDICSTFHACSKPQSYTEEVLADDGKIEMVTSS